MHMYVAVPRATRPRHAPGELVWAKVGNYVENADCRPKARPAVILRATECQHWIAGLTTQPVFKTTGEGRVLLPMHDDCYLRGTSYLWSRKPSRLCRLDVLSHIGWISLEALDVIRSHMQLPWHVVVELRAAVNEMSNTWR
jgi:hypothetical protein